MNLYPWIAPDGQELLITWLKDIADTRTERPTGAALPFIVVRRIGGPEDGLTDKGLYSVHCYASTKSGARLLGKVVHRRIEALTFGVVPVEISTGTAYVDQVVVIEAPRPVEFIDGKTIHRVVGTYEVQLRVTTPASP